MVDLLKIRRKRFSLVQEQKRKRKKFLEFQHKKCSLEITTRKMETLGVRDQRKEKKMSFV